MTKRSTFFSDNAFGRPTAFGALFWASSRPIVDADRWKRRAMSAGVLPWPKWSVRANAFSAGDMRGDCVAAAMDRARRCTEDGFALGPLSLEQAPQYKLGHASCHINMPGMDTKTCFKNHTTHRLQTVDGINFANLAEWGSK